MNNLNASGQKVSDGPFTRAHSASFRRTCVICTQDVTEGFTDFCGWEHKLQAENCPERKARVEAKIRELEPLLQAALCEEREQRRSRPKPLPKLRRPGAKLF